MVFRNTGEAMRILNWWRNECLDWCFDRIEDGKFSDQKYLDDWPSKYPCVHVCTLHGAGIAPWNAIDYEIVGQPSQGHPIQLINRKKKTECELIFFHFHKFRLFEDKVIWERGYRLPKKFVDHIYIPYTNSCLAHYDDLRKVNQNITLPKSSSWSPPNSFFSKTLYFLMKFFYCIWKERRVVIELNNYHIYKINVNKNKHEIKFLHFI